jgi:hypothetical protein
MGKKERHARTAKAEKTSFSKLNNKIRKKGKNKGMLPQAMKSQKKRVEQYGFDLTQASRPQLEKLPVRARLHSFAAAPLLFTCSHTATAGHRCVDLSMVLWVTFYFAGG